VTVGSGGACSTGGPTDRTGTTASEVGRTTVPASQPHTTDGDESERDQNEHDATGGQPHTQRRARLVREGLMSPYRSAKVGADTDDPSRRSSGPVRRSVPGVMVAT
jgi:hypothetical protein